MSSGDNLTEDEDAKIIDEEILEAVIEPNNDVQNKRIFILEPAVFLLFFAWNFSGAIFTNQIIYQTCTEIFQYNKTDCRLLESDNKTKEIMDIEEKVQAYAANIIMARSLIESIIPAICSLFIGPWSDRFGRKPILISNFIGYIFIYMSLSILCLLSNYFPINPWIYIVAFIPGALCGGNCTLITGLFCYVADVTSEKNRAIKMGIQEAALYMGLLLGSFSSSYVYQLTSSAFIFSVATIATFLGFLYILIFINESITINEFETISRLRGLFQLDNVIDMLKTCFKKRTNYDRAIIWLLIITLCIMVGSIDGAGNILYLFVRQKFNWNIKEFTLFCSTSILLQIIGNISAMYIIKKVFNVSDIALAIIALMSSLADSIVLALANLSWHMYLAIGISIFRGISGPMCRAVISNVVPKNEIGKVFSFTSSLESLTPIFITPIYTYVYTNTLSTFPNAFNLISVSIFTLCTVLLIITYTLIRCYPSNNYLRVGL